MINDQFTCLPPSNGYKYALMYAKMMILFFPPRNKKKVFENGGPTDGSMDRLTDRPANLAFYAVARTRLKS